MVVEEKAEKREKPRGSQARVRVGASDFHVSLVRLAVAISTTVPAVIMIYDAVFNEYASTLLC